MRAAPPPNELLSNDFDEHTLPASAIELAEEDLFPRSQVQNPFRTRDVPSAISCRKESRVAARQASLFPGL
jgi:hypothetical protein